MKYAPIIFINLLREAHINQMLTTREKFLLLSFEFTCFRLKCGTYRVKNKDAGFSLGRYEEAKEGLMALTVMVQVNVPYTPCDT